MMRRSSGGRVRKLGLLVEEGAAVVGVGLSEGSGAALGGCMRLDVLLGMW